jgi:hypothetical protein
LTTQAPNTPTTASTTNPLNLPARALELASLLTPAWDQLLVVRDAHSKQIGVGLEGRALVAADTSTDFQPLRSGVVLKAGPSAAGRYPTGTRIAFGEYALTTLGFTADVPGDDERGAEVGLLTSTEVMCWFNVGPEVLPRPLALEGAGYARATPGAVLVERSTAPVRRGRIIVPGGIAGSIRTLEARVVDVHSSLRTTVVAGADCTIDLINPDRCPFEPGDLVLLGPSVGRAIPFGIRQDRVLWSCLPGQILCHVAGGTADAGTGITNDDEETPRAYRGPLKPMSTTDDVRYDEGDRRAPR